MFGNYDSGSAWERNKKIREENEKRDKKYEYASGGYFPIIVDDEEEYALYVTGEMPQKQHELLISVKTMEEERIELKKKEITSFLTIHKRTPDFEEGFKRELLDKEFKIPVCYLKVKDKDNNDMWALGLSHLVRKPYKYSVKDLVEKEQKPELDFDLSELIFGTVSDKRILKGRVLIGNVFASVPLIEKQLGPVISGVLGEPKPSFFPLYLKQDRAPYMTYDNVGSRISGRKLYRVHKGTSVEKLPKGTSNVESSMIPVPAGQEFTMRIVIHNLRKVEIGALLSAITYHDTLGTWHNIGSAKGYGYGKLKCESVSLIGLCHKKEEYLKAYEYELSVFARQKYNEMWNKTEHMQTLGAIASEHNADSVRMMVMDAATSPKNANEYAHYSKDANFSKLDENLKSLPTCLDDADVKLISQEAKRRKRKELLVEFKKSHQVDFEKIVPWASDALHYDLAAAYLSNLLEVFIGNECDADVDKELNAWIRERKIRNVKVSDSVARQITELSDVLTKYQGNKWGAVQSNVLKWQKQTSHSELNDKEKDALEETIKRLFCAPDKKERKDWANAESKIWREIANFLGQDRIDALYKVCKEKQG